MCIANMHCQNEISKRVQYKLPNQTIIIEEWKLISMIWIGELGWNKDVIPENMNYFIWFHYTIFVSGFRNRKIKICHWKKDSTFIINSMEMPECWFGGGNSKHREALSASSPGAWCLANDLLVLKILNLGNLFKK